MAKTVSASAKGVFNCRVCNKGGDVISLVQFLTDCDVKDAVCALTNEPKPSGGGSNGLARAIAKKKQTNLNVVPPVPLVPSESAPEGTSKAAPREPKEEPKAWKLVAEDVYQDEGGQPYLRVRKYRDEDGKKQYPQARWDGQQWVKGKPEGAKLPYRLPQLIAAPLTTPIYFCEGEKDANSLAKIALTATTMSEGASAKWDQTATKYFKDRHVVVLPDADKPGRKHAQKVAKALDGIAASVRVIDLFPDRDDGSDVTDWLADDTAGSRLAKQAKEAPIWEPGSDSNDSGDEAAVVDDKQLVTELAALPKLQYAKRRKEAAKKLGISVSELDKIVAEERKENEDTDAGLYEHWNVVAADEAVDGNVLLQELVGAIRRHVVMLEDQAVVVALWIVMTWMHEGAAVHSPILLATSPKEGTGKSTLLKVVSFLARNGMSSVSITGPALFRSIEKWAPTFLIDEADTAFINNDDLKEVVNSGWTRGDAVIRCDEKTHEPRAYSTFCPKGIGMIGRKLPPATLSRCLIIAMQRKKPDENSDDFDHCDNETFARLRSQTMRWAADNTEALAEARPETPNGFHNRVRANWRLLLAIADQAGGSWLPSCPQGCHRDRAGSCGGRPRPQRPTAFRHPRCL